MTKTFTSEEIAEIVAAAKAAEPRARQRIQAEEHGLALLKLVLGQKQITAELDSQIAAKRAELARAGDGVIEEAETVAVRRAEEIRVAAENHARLIDEESSAELTEATDALNAKRSELTAVTAEIAELRNQAANLAAKFAG